MDTPMYGMFSEPTLLFFWGVALIALGLVLRLAVTSLAGAGERTRGASTVTASTSSTSSGVTQSAA